MRLRFGLGWGLRVGPLWFGVYYPIIHRHTRTPSRPVTSSLPESRGFGCCLGFVGCVSSVAMVLFVAFLVLLLA